MVGVVVGVVVGIGAAVVVGKIVVGGDDTTTVEKVGVLVASVKVEAMITVPPGAVEVLSDGNVRVTSTGVEV